MTRHEQTSGLSDVLVLRVGNFNSWDLGTCVGPAEVFLGAASLCFATAKQTVFYDML